MGTLMCSCNEPQENRNNSVNIYDIKGNNNEEGSGALKNIKNNYPKKEEIADNDINKNLLENNNDDSTEKHVAQKDKETDQKNVLTGGNTSINLKMKNNQKKERASNKNINQKLNISIDDDSSPNELKKKKSKKSKKDLSPVNKNENKNQANKLKSDKSTKKVEKNLIKFTENTFKLPIHKITKKESQIPEISIVLAGYSEVGKTSIFDKVINSKFDNSFYIPTINSEIKSKNMNMNNKIYRITLIDTPGRNEYQKGLGDLFNQSFFIFLIFDGSKINTYENMKEILFEQVGGYGKIYNGIAPNIYIVSNTPENYKKENNETYINFCNKLNLKFFEVCPKNNNGFKNLFDDVGMTYEKIFEA